ncbi:MAG: type II and III secretion system protein [Kiritimatiellae bacterium]|nr:type II and III secretion system protein [Kiritimatiellia bacterium]
MTTTGLTLCAWLAAGTVFAQTTGRLFRVHEIGFADPDAIAEAARAALSEGSRLVVDAPRRRLLVFATESEHSQIADLARAAAAPPPMVRIDVRRRAVGQTSELDAGAAVGGTVVIAPSGSSADISVRPRAEWRASDTSEHLVQTLTVLSGRSASLQIGEEVPYLEWFQQCALGWGLTAAAVRWRAVGASLSIEPTVLGQGEHRQIMIRLVPELSGVSEHGPLRWRFERVATELIVAPGQTVRFGGTSTHADFYDRFLVGIRRGGRHHKIEFELTPTVVDTLPPGGAVGAQGATGR